MVEYCKKCGQELPPKEEPLKQRVKTLCSLIVDHELCFFEKADIRCRECPLDGFMKGGDC